MEKDEAVEGNQCGVDPGFDGMTWLFAENEGVKCSIGELVLWRRVIVLQLFDFCNTSQNPVSVKLKRAAMLWFLRNQKDYRYVCRLADISHDSLTNMVREANNNPKKFIPIIRARLMSI